MRFAVFGMRIREGYPPERFYVVVTGDSYSSASAKAAEAQRTKGFHVYDLEVKTLDT